MQKTEKPPKRSESSGSSSSSSASSSGSATSSSGSTGSRLLDQAPSLHQAIHTSEDFKEQLLKTIQHYALIAESVQNSKIAEPLQEQHNGITFCFERLHMEGDQLVNVAQGALAHLARTQSELEKDPQVRQDSAAKKDLENTQHVLLMMNNWLSHYQSQLQINKQFVHPQPAPQPYTTPKPAASTPISYTVGDPTYISGSGLDNLLQEYINALNVTTVAAFLTALQNLNHYLTLNPIIPISLQQFYALFNQLDKTFQVLPEATLHGQTQRQVIAAMIAVNRQVNQLYGYMMGRQII